MKHISTFQTAELVLIPITFVFSQILIILFGLSIIGEDTWTFMGFPMVVGGLIAISLIIVLNNKVEINKFCQLEIIFRIITIIGGVLFILILGLQIIFQATGILIFSLLSLVISIIGDMMTIQCIYFLQKFVIGRDRSE
ncbi:hypothetical protein CEE45_01135 [Candidatus Heimdallarchaeota archaeon B3_Heim]|nr:MAG: hypothetical protein CEE45_01135 [Candidatus Heimdallarchaeota archaeon B3_Heim]